ncbi:MAG TPA: hypothetical protein VGA25_09415 [Burkholderiales bacterium]
MTDHGIHGRIRVVRGDLNARVLPGKDAEYFVGESLPDRLHVAEIDHDLAELLEIGNEPLAAAGRWARNLLLVSTGIRRRIVN